MDTVLLRVQHSPYVYPRIEGNFFSSTSSGFHFSLLGPPLASPLFACYLSRNGFPAVYFVSILVYPAYGECVSFKTYTLHPRFLFSPSILQSFLVTVPHGFSVSHISSFHFPCLVSVCFFYLRVWVSQSQAYFRLANVADIFERKNVCQKSSNTLSPSPN